MHVADNVRVNRGLLHGQRLALHVHQAHAAVAGSNSLERSRHTQRVDIVDHRCAGRQRRAHDFRLVGIDRNRDATALQRFEHRQQTGEFILERSRNRPRPRRLGPKIEHVGAGRDLMVGMGDGAFRIIGQPVAGKRIRRQIDNPHNQRTIE